MRATALFQVAHAKARREAIKSRRRPFRAPPAGRPSNLDGIPPVSRRRMLTEGRGLRNGLFAGLFSLLLLAGSASRAQEKWPPWEMTAPRSSLKGSERPGAPSSVNKPELGNADIGTAGWPLRWAIRFYQATLTHADGPTCRYYPACSQYAAEAIGRHGPFMGFVMSAERVMRRHKAHVGDAVIRLGDFNRYADPLDANDFWWWKKAVEAR